MILRAKWVIPEPDRWIENGCVRIEGSRIAEVGRWNRASQEAAPVEDFGEAVILPGLVNAHTHLELTYARVKRTRSLPLWLLQVASILPRHRQAVERAAWEGIRRTLQGGGTTVGDITATGWSTAVLRRSSLRFVSFHEVLGLTPDRLPRALDKAAQALQIPESDRGRVGLSPHAPYSTSASLYQHVVALARQHDRLACSHVAECPEEREFLERGTGPFRYLLTALRVPLERWQPPGWSPVRYLAHLGVLERLVLVHANYLDEDEMRLIAECQAVVVYCPRSHRYFSHAPHPFARLREAGVRVALGTDSLASNWDLSMLEEVRFLASHRPDLSPESLLDMATYQGARALGWSRLGKLRPGWLADLIVVPLEPNSGASPLEQLLTSASQSVCTIVAGQVAWRLS